MIVWDSPDDPPAASLVYLWTGYAESSNTRSLLRYVDANGERLRARYIAWVHDLGESRLGGERLVDHFAAGDGFSFWWMSLFVEKSPWKTPAVMEAIRLLALEEIVVAGKPSTIRVVTRREPLAEAIREFCAASSIGYERERPARVRESSGARHIGRALPHPVRAVGHLLRHSISRWRLRKAPRRGWFDGPDAVFFVSYFIHLDVASCREGRFLSRHWEGIPAMLLAAGKRLNWLQHYLQSAAVPDIATALDWTRRFNEQRNAFHTFVDGFLSLPLVLRTLARWMRHAAAASRIREIDRAFAPAGSRMSFWPIMRDDWLKTTRGAVAMDNMLWFELLRAATKSLPHQRTGVFLTENQAWERVFIHLWRKAGHGRLIGVSHSTVRFWDLRYAVDPRSIMSTGLNALPTADLVALNGPAALQAFRDMAYPAPVVETEAQRYGHLAGRPKRARRGDSAPTRVLVLGDYMPDGTRRMMRLLAEAARLAGDAVEYTVKPHPSNMIDPAEYPSLHLRVVTDALGGILDQYDIAYASNNTSAAVDAYFVGMPVAVGLDDEDLNFSPLRGREGVTFVSTPEELTAAIRSARDPRHGAASDSGFFHLDAGLPRWKELLTGTR